MPNIKFNYFSRCSGTYKKRTSVIFANPLNIDLAELRALVKFNLIDATWFYTNVWCLPEIFTNTVDFRIDPTWHEFENVEYTDEIPNTTLVLTYLIEVIQN